MDNRIAKACLTTALLLVVSAAAPAQNIVVDSSPSHVANSFSPFRALGAAVDRLRAPGGRGHVATRAEAEKHVETVLSNPVLKEILGAGWQTVTYRQNTE